MSQNDADLDPFGPWRQLRDATMDVWAKSMAETVNTEAFAQNMGAYLNTYLATSAPMQKFVEQYMEATLARLSMPSRDEVIELARRMVSVEMRLDDIDAKLDTLLRHLQTQPAAAAQHGQELNGHLQAIQQQLERLAVSTAALAEAPEGKPVPARRGRTKAEPEPQT
jgi:polyhydroxyalkanoic acid synthase PhaR subunit